MGNIGVLMNDRQVVTETASLEKFSLKGAQPSQKEENSDKKIKVIKVVREINR